MNTPPSIYEHLETDNAVYLPQTETYAREITTTQEPGSDIDRAYITTHTPDQVIEYQRFMGDATYSESLSSLIVPCVDILVVDPEGKVLIGTRQQEPQPGDWLIGGRMRAGESNADAATRNLHRELHIDINETKDQNKLKDVGRYDLLWDTREQPANTDESGQTFEGCHMASRLLLYPVSADVASKIENNEEYSALRWEDPLDIMDAPEGTYHPAMVQMVKDGLDVMTRYETGKNPANDIRHFLGGVAYARSKQQQLQVIATAMAHPNVKHNGQS